MPLSRVVEIARQVLAAVEYAHERQVVHRDLKPSNILLDKAGKAYLTDFGVALALGGRRVTRIGLSVGTSEYMSPEQVSRPFLVGGRSDLYSFGVVLYELLTGRLPFDVEEGDRDFLLKQKHLTELPVPPRQWNPAIPPEVEAVVLRALRKEPEERFQRALEMSEALERAAEVPRPDPVRAQPVQSSGAAPRPAASVAPVPIEPPSPPPAPRPRGVGGRIVIALLLVGMAAGAWWFWRGQAEQKSAVHTTTGSGGSGTPEGKTPGGPSGGGTGGPNLPPISKATPPPPPPPSKRKCTDNVAENLPSQCPDNDQFCKTCKAEKGIPDGTGVGK
jgi:serine/threonine protein kinase